MRWIAWICLFDFDVQHILGKKHTVVDGLFRHLHIASNMLDNELKEDIDDFIDAQLDVIQIALIQTDNTLPDDTLMLLLEKQEIDNGILDGYYSICSRKYAQWLTILRRPKDMTMDEF